MKTTINIDNNFSYQVNLDEEGSFVMINGILINKNLLFELEFIQGKGFESICVGYADLFSFLVEAGIYIDRPGEHRKLLEFVQLQFSMLKYLNPARLIAGTKPEKELLPSSEETLMGHLKADAS